jgi:hypothetical protein
VVALKRPPVRKRLTPSEDPPPHGPLHVRGCSRCAAWRSAQKLGMTLAAYCQWQSHAYENSFGDHPPYVPGPQPDPNAGLR